MAPTTRASAKGHVSQPKNGKKRGRGKKPENTKKPEPELKKPDVKTTRCRFLELPPEIRNRIYEFAREIKFEDGFEPPLLTKTTKGTITPYKYGGRNFFALTQTCKQIRSEFRPLWLRQSAIRISFGNLTPYITAYYSNTEEYQNAPRLLLVSWDPDEDEDEDALFDITILLRLRARCPTFTAQFVSHKHVEGDLPDIECDECGHNIHCNCGIDCDHEEARGEAYCQLFLDTYYLNALNGVLTNNNETWLKAVREDGPGGMKVEFTYENCRNCTIYIRFTMGRAPALFKKSDMYNTAIRYLNTMGMFNLDFDFDEPHGDELGFVVGEATGKYSRHSGGCGFPVPTYNQVLVPGDMDKKAIMEAASST